MKKIIFKKTALVLSVLFILGCDNTFDGNGTTTNNVAVSNTQTQTSTQSKTDTQTQTATQPETDTQTQTVTQQETDTQIQTATQSKTDTQTQTATQSKTDTQTQTATQQETDTQTQTDMFVNVERFTLPNKVEFEHYHRYEDSDAGNKGELYRNDDVDLQNAEDEAGGINVGWAVDGEWLEYDVDVLETASYQLIVRVALNRDTSNLMFDIDGQNIFIENVPTTNGWQTWDDFSVNIGEVAQGHHTFKFEIKNSGINLNWFELIKLDDMIESMDADQDGVLNELDECPNTVNGVFEVGCSFDQLNALGRITPSFVEFKEAKDSHSPLPFPDFSYAGYKKSEEPIPNPDWPIFNVTDYGAIPDDNNDDLDAINLAVTAAANNSSGAIVFFPKGRYLLSENKNITKSLITISASHLILRGEGDEDGGTELYFKENLVTTTPSKKWTTPKMIVATGSGTSYKGDLKTQINKNAKIGDTQIELKNASAFNSGDYIIFNLNDPSAANNQEIAPYQVEDNWTKFKTGEYRREMNQIKSITGNVIELEAPIAMDINVQYKWEARLMKLGTHFAIENMTLRGNWQDDFVHHKDAIHDSGWGALSISKYADSWLKDVRFIDWNSTAHISSSIFSSFVNVNYEGNRGHSSLLTSGTYGILITHSNDSSDEGMFHAQGVESYSAVSVFHKVKWPQDTSFDSHASFPHATLFDSVTGGFTDASGGNGGADSAQPNHMEDLIFWNFKDLGGNDHVLHDWWKTSSKYHRFYLPKFVGWHGALAKFKDSQVGLIESHGTAVYPDSLFEAQLKLRLGYLPNWLNELNTQNTEVSH